MEAARWGGGLHPEVEDHRHCQGLHLLLQDVSPLPHGESENYAHRRHPQQEDRVLLILPSQGRPAPLVHLYFGRKWKWACSFSQSLFCNFVFGTENCDFCSVTFVLSSSANIWWEKPQKLFETFGNKRWRSTDWFLPRYIYIYIYVYIYRPTGV